MMDAPVTPVTSGKPQSRIRVQNFVAVEGLTHLVGLPQISQNLRVAEMTHRSWLTPSDRHSVIQMTCINCGAVSNDVSLLCITKHP